MYDLREYEPVRFLKLKKADDKILGCALANDGRRVIVSSSEGGLQLWQLTPQDDHLTPQDVLAQPRKINEGWDPSGGCAISGNGKFALASCNDGKLRVLDVDSGESRELEMQLSNSFALKACALSGDGTIAACVAGNGQLKVWDMKHGREWQPDHEALPKTLPAHACAMSDDGNRILVVRRGEREAFFRVWQRNINAASRALHAID